MNKKILNSINENFSNMNQKFNTLIKNLNKTSLSLDILLKLNSLNNNIRKTEEKIMNILKKDIHSINDTTNNDIREIIEIEKKNDKIINKFLPYMICYSLYLDQERTCS